MVLVVYYSRKGHVRKMAEEYARRHGYDLCRIGDTVARSGVIGFIRAGMQARKRIETPIEPITADLEAYDRVVVCGPVWAGTIACPVRTFLRQYGSRLKDVEYVLVSASKSGSYDTLFDEMDAVCGLKRSRGVHLSQGQELN